MWIRIEEKKPPIRKQVLLFFLGGRVCVGHRIRIRPAKYDIDKYWVYYDEGKMPAHAEVLFWHLLPKLPEGVNDVDQG